MKMIKNKRKIYHGCYWHRHWHPNQSYWWDFSLLEKMREFVLYLFSSKSTIKSFLQGIVCVALLGLVEVVVFVDLQPINNKLNVFISPSCAVILFLIILVVHFECFDIRHRCVLLIAGLLRSIGLLAGLLAGVDLLAGSLVSVGLLAGLLTNVDFLLAGRPGHAWFQVQLRHVSDAWLQDSLPGALRGVLSSSESKRTYGMLTICVVWVSGIRKNQEESGAFALLMLLKFSNLSSHTNSRHKNQNLDGLNPPLASFSNDIVLIRWKSFVNFFFSCLGVAAW